MNRESQPTCYVITEPVFENFSGGFQVVFPANPSETPQVAPQVTPKVEKLLSVMKGDMDREALQKAAGLQKKLQASLFDSVIKSGIY